MSKIKEITAREIKDSRGRPTVEVELETEKGSFIASCPSGASVGKNEAAAIEVSKAIENINEVIAPKLKGKNPENQKEIDETMLKIDGTENKSKLGANAILPVSMAVCRAGASAKRIPLYQHIAELAKLEIRNLKLEIPKAMFNILEGGRHAQNKLSMQEFLIIPLKKTFAENLILCNKIFENLKNILEKNFGKDGLDVGFEGGFAAPVAKTEQALFSLMGAIGKEDCKIALDAAASEFYNPTAGGGKYNLDGQSLSRAELLEFYESLIKNFPIVSIEDPFAQDDWQGWQAINSKSKIQNPKLLIIGDDLTTTNIKRIKEAHSKNACNGVILKLNQIGTVSETIQASNLAKSYGWKTVVSHRSGETMDDFIADLAIGLGADFIKSGSPIKPERMVKYKRLMEIEEKVHQSLKNQ